jgi:hypothetical protein
MPRNQRGRPNQGVTLVLASLKEKTCQGKTVWRGEKSRITKEVGKGRRGGGVDIIVLLSLRRPPKNCGKAEHPPPAPEDVGRTSPQKAVDHGS